MRVVFVIAAVAFFILAGLKVHGRFFAPEWFGLACLVAAWGWPLITA